MSKRQNITYNNAACAYLIDNFGEKSLKTIRTKIKKLTGKRPSATAIKLKARRLGLEPLQTAHAYILIKHLNNALHTTQGSIYAKQGNFTKHIEGINGTVVDVKKFWEFIKQHENIDISHYEKGTLLPEPKPDASGKSWLDIRIKQQQEKRKKEINWDQTMIAKLKTMLQIKGYTIKEIAQQLGITENQVNYRIKKYNLIRRTQIKITDQERAEVRKLYSEGATILGLSKMYCRTPRTIRRMIQGGEEPCIEEA